MDRVGRFLWLPWVRGRALSHKRSGAGHLAYWEGEHDGYERLSVPVLHRRAILRFGDHWLVLDRLTSVAEHEYRLHWLLMDAPYEWDERQRRLKLKTPEWSYYVQIASSSKESVSTVVRADESSPRGWRAPYYNYREPALSLALTARASAVQFWTLFGPGRCEATSSDESIDLQANQWQATINTRGTGDQRRPLIVSVRASGAISDHLENL